MHATFFNSISGTSKRFHGKVSFFPVRFSQQASDNETAEQMKLQEAVAVRGWKIRLHIMGSFEKWENVVLNATLKHPGTWNLDLSQQWPGATHPERAMAQASWGRPGSSIWPLFSLGPNGPVVLTGGCLSQVLPAPEMVKQVEQEEEAPALWPRESRS